MDFAASRSPPYHSAHAHALSRVLRRHNLVTNPLVARDGCDYLSLFVPDLIADPWERSEAGLGYRLARPRYAGPNRLWERHRLWGAQAYLLSRRLVLACLERWDRLAQGQDARVLSACGELGVALWYTDPCLVEHAPLRSAFGTPAVRAPDFDADFRLELGSGFRPPDGVPGDWTAAESRALWEAAAGRAVLELGAGAGRATVCLAQSASRVVSDGGAEAAEWARRFGVADRVEFRGAAGEGPFGLAVLGDHRTLAELERAIAEALPLLEPGGLLAFGGYPDPACPDVRRVVDSHAAEFGWRRVRQADFIGIFATPAARE